MPRDRTGGDLRIRAFFDTYLYLTFTRMKETWELTGMGFVAPSSLQSSAFKERGGFRFIDFFVLLSTRV